MKILIGSVGQVVDCDEKYTVQRVGSVLVNLLTLLFFSQRKY